MNPQAVTEVLADVRAALQLHSFGVVDVAGTLSGWRTHRSGFATAEITGNDGSPGRLRITARPASAQSAAAELDDHRRSVTDPGDVVVHGQLTIDDRWGLQLVLLRLECVGDAPNRSGSDRAHPNATTHWPDHIHSVGLVAPSGGDDARNDVVAHLATTALTVIEHRVPVTGPGADRAIGQALDRLALRALIDITLLVRGGGPTIDFAPFNSSLVVAAIDRHPHPVVTGLGHADNHTDADIAAHTAAITPTAAAQLILDQRTPQAQSPAPPPPDTNRYRP